MTHTIACPKCSHPLTFEPRDARYVCVNCGYRRYETLEEAQERMRDDLKAIQEAPAALAFRGEVHHRARSLYEDGRAHAARGEHAAAITAFERALEMQPDFIDAHLAIARLLDDAARKRAHIEQALAYDPGSAEALRELMIIDGRLTVEQAERARTGGEIIIRHSSDAVETSTERLQCPQCGGVLTADERTGQVSCKFCGYAAPLQLVDAAADHIGMAMLERKGKGRAIWQVGERIVHCNQCGADRTLPARQMSLVCPFCGSSHVIEADALGSFERPDGLIAFSVTEADAQTIIREKLNSLSEKVAGWFDDNRIARAAMAGVYLPFWMFDAVVNVTQTIEDRRDHGDIMRRYGHTPAVQTLQFGDGALGLLIPAVESPPPRLIAAADDYDLGALTSYDAALLARYPAELYSIDYTAAALTAQSRIVAQMRARHARQASESVRVTVSAFPTSMTFSLLLLPMWIATLTERDGDRRSALVNGQTGTCVLSRKSAA
jgi:uncharacterized Zn finger protein (UPF0148 family)